MKEFLEWLEANKEWLVNLVQILVSLGAWTYATIIHYRSKVRLSTLEAKKEIEEDLINQLKNLRNALKEEE